MKCNHFQGSAYSRADLRAVNVDFADMVLIFSPSLAKDEEHQALLDKESILVTQNLKAMTFDSPSVENGNEPDNRFVEHLDAMTAPLGLQTSMVKARVSKRGANIPMITELGKWLGCYITFSL